MPLVLTGQNAIILVEFALASTKPLAYDSANIFSAKKANSNWPPAVDWLLGELDVSRSGYRHVCGQGGCA